MLLNNINKMQSGVSLYLAIIVMVILLAIVLGLTTILVGQMKMVREMGYSVIALSAADAGIEAILVDQADPASTDAYTTCPSTVPGSFCLLSNGAKYYLGIRTNADDPACPNYCITSVGIYKGVRRAIEVTY
jgi:Tfp pilus assembly protein PilV